MSYVKQNANQKLEIKNVTMPPPLPPKKTKENKTKKHKFKLGDRMCLAITFPL